MSSYADAHCHLTDDRLTGNADSVLAASATAGIHYLLQGGGDPEEWEAQADLARRFPGRVLPVYGLHPWAVHNLDDAGVASALAILDRRLRSDPRPVALGELGLDRALRGSKNSWARQQATFRRQLAMAAELSLPLVLHVVQAHGVALGILEEFRGRHAGGIVHAFAGEAGIVKQYRAAGFVVSLAPGSLVRMDASVVAALGDDDFVLESDAPDAAFPARDRPAELLTPASLLTHAAQVAALRGTTTEALLARSTATIRRIFSLDHPAG